MPRLGARVGAAKNATLARVTRRSACDFAAAVCGLRAMMPVVRAPKTTDLFHAPPEFLCGGQGTPVTLPLGGPVRSASLRAFLRAMSARGTGVQAARFGYDRIYAAECLARAHASGDAALRALALELFASLERHPT